MDFTWVHMKVANLNVTCSRKDANKRLMWLGTTMKWMTVKVYFLFCGIKIIWGLFLYKYKSKSTTLFSIVHISVYASWGEWGEWGSCTKSCDGGFRTRSRECFFPNSQIPIPKGYGNVTETCSGDRNERAECNQDACQGNNTHLICIMI